MVTTRGFYVFSIILLLLLGAGGLAPRNGSSIFQSVEMMSNYSLIFDLHSSPRYAVVHSSNNRLWVANSSGVFALNVSDRLSLTKILVSNIFQFIIYENNMFALAGNTLYCYDFFGSLLWKVSGIAYGYFTIVRLGEEVPFGIVVASWGYGYIYVIDASNGSLLETIRIPAEYRALNVFDVDNDGYDEIFLSTSWGYVYALDPSENFSIMWKICLNATLYRPSIAVMLVNETPTLAVVPIWSNSIFLIDARSGSVIERAEIAGARFYSPMGIGDIDLDGDIELILWSWGSGSVYRVYAVDLDGQVLWTFDTLGPVDVSPLVADLSGDGVPDVIVADRAGYVYVLNGCDGSLLWRLDVGAPVRVTPAVADIDNDGHLDLIVAADSGYVYAYKFSSSSLNVYWGMFQGSPTASGVQQSVDGDLDLLSDYTEALIGTDPHNPDTDGDGMCDSFEYIYGLNPLDPADASSDPDKDGLLNLNESIYWCDPFNPDTDGDNATDGWEIEHGFDPRNSEDGFLDNDSDDLRNSLECLYGTDPFNNDTDSDGMPDGWEVKYSLDPLNTSDGSLDLDGDNLTNLEEFRYGTDPLNNDTDNDGLPDGWEVGYDLDPLDSGDNVSDLDSDLLTNVEEYKYGTDPRNPDTDGDGFLDGDEVFEGFDPLDPLSHPIIPWYERWRHVVLTALVIAIGLVIAFGYFKVYRPRVLTKIERINQFVRFWDNMRRKIIEEQVNQEFINSLPPRQREALMYYIEKGDEFLAVVLAGVSFDEFDELLRKANISRVLLYE
ncbi:MAG: FG-GAP-like repeat-containing protein [Candidatus Njordarchaeales archaeon]